MRIKRGISLALCLALAVFSAGCAQLSIVWNDAEPSRPESASQTSADVWEEYSGEAYISLGSAPQFSAEELSREPFESYSELDRLGRCGKAEALCGRELMPTGERGSIGSIKPSGWHTVKYDFINGKYLYNRCHLIGWQLTGQNANPKNLITGTRYLNTEGMLLFENMIADYIKETGNHVLYRVTPDFREDESVARGVQLEALSVEDGGDGVCFNVYVYNVQPGVVIDYSTGDSRAEDNN